MAQHPGDSQLRHGLAARRSDFVQLTNPGDAIFGYLVAPVERAGQLDCPRVAGQVLEVLVGEYPLAERRKGDAANALLCQHVQQAILDPTVEHVVARLVNETGRAQLAQNGGGLPRLLRAVGRDTGVDRLAAAHDVVQRAQRLLHRCVGVRAVAVEDVHIVQPHALEALVEAGDQVLARSPLAVGAGPHVVAGFAGDHQLVAVAAQVLGQDSAKGLLR